MCFIGYPTHYAFKYFFHANETSFEDNTTEINLAKNYQKDMELADSIFHKMVSEDFDNVDKS